MEVRGDTVGYWKGEKMTTLVEALMFTNEISETEAQELIKGYVQDIKKGQCPFELLDELGLEHEYIFELV